MSDVLDQLDAADDADATDASSSSSALFEDSASVALTIRATISRVCWSENGRVIARANLAPDSRRGSLIPASLPGAGRTLPSEISVVGALADPLVGQLYEFTGELEYNRRFKSYQINFTSYRTILPTDTDGIMAYLIDVARWVGPSIAKSLVDAYGGETLHIIRQNPDRIAALAVPGLTPARIAEMQRTLVQNEKLEAATVQVNNLLAGVLGPATTAKAIRAWGCDAATVIRENPYVLQTLPGVGFLSADAIARRLQIDPQDQRRHSAALLHVLGEISAREGHTVVSRMRAEMDAARLVGALRTDTYADLTRTELVDCDADAVTVARIGRAEKYIAGKVLAMLRGTPAPVDVPAAGLATDQAAAVQAFRDAPVFLLVGAPGTGKTYTVARIVRACQDSGLTVGLCAPTGKAAKQMSLALESVCPGAYGRTIHSLLEPTVDESGEFLFSRGEQNPLEYDVLVVDEFSMVDVSLCASLLRAVRETTRLLIVGDHYQLPSVGPGAVLRDLLRAGVPSFELREIKRNAGRIVRACHAIKDGLVPEPSARLDLEAGENWRHVEVGSVEAIRDVIHQLVAEKLPALGIDPRWGWQLVSPTNEKGPLSCDALNLLAREIMNPAAEPVKGLKFGVGDKVVRTKNGSARGRFLEEEEEEEASIGDMVGEDVRIVNGDIGIVRGIDAQEIWVDLRYPAREVFIKRNDHHLRQAYCMTCHKMQGSEVDVVVLPLHRSIANLPMVSREWIYTALSRAKKFIVTVGDLSALAPMVARVSTHRRQTTLRQLVEKLLTKKGD